MQMNGCDYIMFFRKLSSFVSVGLRTQCVCVCGLNQIGVTIYSIYFYRYVWVCTGYFIGWKIDCVNVERITKMYLE